MDAAPLDPADLPGYVGELFDFYAEHPDMLRLVGWSRLDPNEALVGLGEAGAASLRAKLEAIRQGQLDGVLDDAFEPLDILLVLVHLSMGWLMAIEFHALEDPADPGVLERRRSAAVLAAERLFPRR